MAPDFRSKDQSMNDREGRLLELVRDIGCCRHCLENPTGLPLPHEPRPVLRVSTTARICIIGQAPGVRVHASGRPFTDPSGDRLRMWMGVTREEFYNDTHIAIIPMGFCFPGLDKKGGDLPPRKECALKWHDELFALMPQIELKLLVGLYAQHRHLGKARHKTLTQTVRHWRSYVFDNKNNVINKECGQKRPMALPMPHPSWRNNAWLRNNPFFERDVVPFLRREVKRLIAKK
jgi:uracil-DNA glycosylase